MTALTLSADDVRYPARLRERLGDDAPAHISALGNLDLQGWQNFQSLYKHLVDAWLLFDNSGITPGLLDEGGKK